jgi:curved DNA-binding protein CbpA
VKSGGGLPILPVRAGRFGARRARCRIQPLEDGVPKLPKFKDYYQVLGVPPRCHHRLIEESYWELAHGLHSVPTRKAQHRLAALNEAYETLGSPHKRSEYDRRWEQRAEQSNGHERPGFLQLFVNLLGKPFRPD